MSGRNTEKESNAKIESMLPSQVNITAWYLITPTSARQSNSQSLEQRYENSSASHAM